MYQIENSIYVLSPDRRCLIKVASGEGKRKNWRESTTYTDDRGRLWEFNTNTRRWGLHPDHKKPKGKRRAEFEQYLQDPGDPELKQVFNDAQDASDRFDESQNKIRSLLDDMKTGADDLDQLADEILEEHQKFRDAIDGAPVPDLNAADLPDINWDELMSILDEGSAILDRKPPQRFEIDLQAMSNILPFDLTSQRQTRQVLNQIEAQLESLTDLSAEARAEAALRGFIDTLHSIFESASEGLTEVQPILDKLTAKRLDRLERAYEGKGRVDRDTAKIAALNKRIFETLHPRKLVWVPAGTTQAEYAAIVQRLAEGDKKAIKEYTVKKPAPKKRKGKRK